MTGRLRSRRAVWLVAAVALLASGCRDAGTGGGTDPSPTALPGTDPAESPPAAAPSPQPPPFPPDPEQVGPQEDLEDVRPYPWDEVFVLGGGDGIELRWRSEPCLLLDRIEVEYTDQAVILTLFLGKRDADAPCDDPLVYRARRRSLPEPVGGRSLADGAEL